MVKTFTGIVKMKRGWSKELSKEVLQEVLSQIGGDGHSIWCPTILTKAGVSEEIVDNFVENIESGSHHKERIFGDNGQFIPEVKGVYGLNFLSALAKDLEVTWESKMGRGFEARVITAAIQTYVKGIKMVKE